VVNCEGPEMQIAVAPGTKSPKHMLKNWLALKQMQTW
jgi:hypothetical protein